MLLATACLRFTEYHVGLKTHINIIMKPTSSPTQGQPKPKKNYVKKWHLGYFFSQQLCFRGLGLVYIGNRLQEISPQTPYLRRCRTRPYIRLLALASSNHQSVTPCPLRHSSLCTVIFPNRVPGEKTKQNENSGEADANGNTMMQTLSFQATDLNKLLKDVLVTPLWGNRENVCFFSFFQLLLLFAHANPRGAITDNLFSL